VKGESGRRAKRTVQSQFIANIDQPTNPTLSRAIQEIIKARMKTMMFDEQGLEAMKGKEGSGDG
jgi:hypothetical protein